MALPTGLLSDLADMPRQVTQALRLLPIERLAWRPESWGGCPSEHFSALEQVCHLRDIEKDGYHLRIRRMLDEVDPTLEPLDSYEIARQRGYGSAHIDVALAEFREARAATVARLRDLSEADLARTGDFAEYGRLTLQGLIHYLRSHDQQHLAGLQWLAGKVASLS